MVDAAIIALHLSSKILGVPGGDHFDLGVDRSYGEILTYVKLAWIAVLAFILARRRAAMIFTAVGVAGIVLLLEDALILHERLGWYLNERVLEAFPALSGLGIMSVQIGELMWLCVPGVAMLVLFVVGYRRAAASERRDALSIAVFFAVVAFFAIVVDTVHSLFAMESLGDLVFTVLEDGGELVALTPAVALTFALTMEVLGRADRSSEDRTEGNSDDAVVDEDADAHAAR